MIELSEIAAIVGAAKGDPSFLGNQFLASLQPLFDKLENVKNDTTKVDITALLKLGDNDKNRFQDQYKKILSSYLRVFGKKVTELERLSPSELLVAQTNRRTPPPLPNAINPSPRRNQQSSDNSFDNGETETISRDPSVRISSIDDAVLKQISDYLPQGSNTISVEDSGSSSGGGSGKSKGLFGKLLGGLLLGGVSALGLAALFQGFKTDGSFKGILRIIGETLIKPIIGENGFPVRTIRGIGGLLDVTFGKAIKTSSFATFLKRTFQVFARPFQSIAKLGGKGLKVVSKSIPFLGAFISFAFAYSRFKANDNLGGILEIAAGLSSFVPAIGTGLSFAINLFLAGRDLTTTREQRRNNIGGNLLMKIKDFFVNLPVVKAYTNLFSGVYDLFTAQSPQEIDAAINKIQDTDAMAIFSFMNPLVGIYNFLRVADNREVIKQGFINAGDFLKGMWMKIWNFFDNLADILGNFFENLFFNFQQSNFFKGLQTRMEILTNRLKLGILFMTGGITKLIQGLTEKVVSVVDNGTVKGVLRFLKQDNLVEDIEALRSTSRQFTDINIDQLSSDLRNQNEKLRGELEGFIKAQKETADKETLRNEQRHQEMMQVSKENAAAVAGASNGTTAAVLSKNNAPERKGGNITNIFNQDGANNIRRTKQASFRDSLYDLP